MKNIPPLSAQLGLWPLVVQWLKLHTYTAGGMGSILGQGTKIPHVMQHGPPKKKKTRLGLNKAEGKSINHATAFP